MLTEAFPRLADCAFIRLARQYLSSLCHIAVVAVLTLVSALFGWEVPVFYCYMALSVFAFFVGDDAVGIVPVLLFGYASLSYKNNPFQNNPSQIANAPLFSNPAIIMQIGYCVGVIVMLLFIRTVYDLITKPKCGTPRLWLGFVLLAAGYLLGGSFTKYYCAKGVLFSVFNILCIALVYFLFRYSVNWEKIGKDYVFRLFTVLGAVVLAQIISVYFREGAIVDGVSYRGRFGTGWGHYNTVGCVMAMCACMPLYFSATKKHGWAFTVLAIVYFLGVVLAQSRGAILFGSIVFVAALIFALVKAQKRERIFSLIVAGVFAAAVIVAGACCFGKLKEFFSSMLNLGADDNGRVEIFEKAWAYFLSFPVFGVGWGGDMWYTDGTNMFQFFMVHNTVLQLLGCFGIVGTLFYGFHRLQTCILVFKQRSAEKFFCAFSVLVLLLSGMMDVHIFSCNLTGLLYSGLLVFMEGSDIKRGADTRIKLKKRKD